MGSDKTDLSALLDHKFSKVLDVASLIIIGQGALCGPDGADVLAAAMDLAERTKSKFMVLHTAAGRVGAMDLGCTSDGGADKLVTGADVVYNLGSDEVTIADGPFVIYQGSHGDRGAHRADVILPGAAYTEESGIFVNTEGRAQMSARAGFAPGDARENWAILRALSGVLGQTLPFDSQSALRAAMFKQTPTLGAIDQVPQNDWQPITGKKLGKGILKNAVTEHFQTNPIARASQIMAELAANAAARKASKLAAE
jgi:NADH-quinone oxidoreductase subunit G